MATVPKTVEIVQVQLKEKKPDTNGVDNNKNNDVVVVNGIDKVEIGVAKIAINDIEKSPNHFAQDDRVDVNEEIVDDHLSFSDGDNDGDNNGDNESDSSSESSNNESDSSSGSSWKTSKSFCDENDFHIANNDHLEPLLCENIDEDRFLLFPIRHNDIFDMYKLQVAQFWTAEEINLSKDLADWQKLRPHERNFFKRILAFFAPSDGIVGENLLTRFYSDVGYTEARYFYAFQAAMENIHAEVYGLLIKNLIPDENEQNELFGSFVHTPGIKEKVAWAKRWISSKKPFAVRLVAFAVVEGLLFSGSFASIFWLKKVGLLPGLTFSNELISRDEGLHCDFACLLYNNHIVHKLPPELIQTIVGNAVEAEQIFFEHAFNGMSVGEMNTNTMLQYVRFCADRLLSALNVPKLFNVGNPFDFMHLISLDGRTNFFERRVGEYRQSRVATNGIDESKIFLRDGAIDLDYDF